MTAPVLFPPDRYEPRPCAAHNCSEPPIATYTVAVWGVLYGREWNTGQLIHVCVFHDDEAARAVR